MAVDDECQVGGEGGGRSQSPRSSLRASDWSALLRSINSNYEAVIGLMGRFIISLQDRIDFRLDGRGWGGGGRGGECFVVAGNLQEPLRGF